MTPFRVLHLVTSLEPGGAQRNTLHTVSALDRSLFAPALAAGPSPGKGGLDPAALAPAVPFTTLSSLVRPLRPLADLRAVREVRALIRRLGDVAVVHTHSSKAGIVGRFAAAAERVPVVVHTIHGFGVTPAQNPLLRAALLAAERAAARRTDCLIAVSRANRDQGAAWGLFPPARCVVIRSGVELGAFAAARADRERLFRETGIPASAPLVLMPACLKPQKAPLDFVRAAALVLREHPGARFAVAGDGELAGAVRAEAERLGIAPALHLLGWRDDLPFLMACAQVVVLTSRWEGLPQVVPQARAAGRPVVATAVDGTPEAVEDGLTGFLTPPGDFAATAQRVSLLLAQPALALKMGERAREGLEEFDRERMVRAQEELYLELLAEKGMR